MMQAGSRLSAKMIRTLLITAVSVLGGVIAAALYQFLIGGGAGDAEFLGFPQILWLPFLVGVAIANHLARWYSVRFPSRYSDPWAYEIAAMERARCVGFAKRQER